MEDNPINQLLLQAQVSELGYRSRLAASGAEAIDAAGREEFDAILMDCQMPDVDGFEATRRIRGSGGRRVPIIAVTANAMAGDREKCIGAGMDDYLTNRWT